MAFKPQSRKARMGGLALAAVVASVVTWIAASHHANMPIAVVPTPWTMIECLEKYTPKGTEPPSINTIHQFASTCSGIIFAQNSLNDFNLRRIKMVQQQYDGIVLLWMVVAITVSGVVLAGLQLLISYRLADAAGVRFAESSTVITVEQNRLIFKSSVTGLAILMISFAFFLVFVLEIYNIREVSVDPASATKTAAASTPALQAPVPLNGYGPGTAATPTP